MTSALKSASAFRASDSYLRSVRQFALRPLKDKAEYRVALDVLGRLAMRQNLDEGQRDYLGALSQFVGDYERDKLRLLAAEMKPLELLRYLMQENNMTTSDLGYVLGSRGLASEVLNGKRGLSKTLIHRLAERFAVDPGAFLDKP